MANISFESQVARFAKKARVKSAAAVHKVAFDLLRGVIMRSPVDTGRFRGNWNLAEHSPDKTDYGEDKSGHQALARGANELNNIIPRRLEKGAVSIWITNNVPYAQRLERGYSRQAPRGVLATTFAEVTSGLGL